MKRSRWSVVGTDFSEGATLALKYAVNLAGEIGASVACVHAYEDAADTPASYDPTPELRKQIEEAISFSGNGKHKVHVEPVVRRGAPWDKLVNVATDLGAELIVVGADGQRGASHARFLGTVANRLATTSSRSVVVVPSRPLSIGPGDDPRDV
jgi:nucleotide-binding universal stress UspA family protein